MTLLLIQAAELVAGGVVLGMVLLLSTIVAVVTWCLLTLVLVMVKR